MSDYSPADILRKWLVDSGLGAEEEPWRAFVSFLPDEPYDALCVYDTASKLDGRLLGTGEQIEHPGVMVWVRGPIFPEAWEKVRAIAIAMDAVRNVTVSMDADTSYMIHNVSRTGSVKPLGVEEEGSRRRYDFSINAVLTLTKQE